jgi:hypothetical protein
MNATAFETEVSPEAYAAVDAVLRNIDHENQQRASLETLAQWKLVFKMYRQLELHFEMLKNRAPYEKSHRVVLTSLLALTEALQLGIENLSDSDLGRISLSKATFEGCTRFVRRKYNQWFAPIDSSVVRKFEEQFAQ